MVSVTTIQLHYGSTEAAINTYMDRCVRVPIKLYLQKQVASWNWPMGSSLLSPGLHDLYDSSSKIP